MLVNKQRPENPKRLPTMHVIATLVGFYIALVSK